MIRLKNVCKVIGENQILLNGITLSVSQGDYICISGSPLKARNELARMMSGLSVPTCGEVYIDGVEICQYSQNQLAKLRREKLSCMFLDMGAIDDLSVLDNIKLPLMYSGKTKENRTMLLDKAISILGLQKLIGCKFSELSDWQKNKVLLARTIVTSPRTIIIEEPCRNFDLTNIIEVESLLSALNAEGITVVVFSNHPYYIERAKKSYKLASAELTCVKEEKTKENEFKAIKSAPKTRKRKQSNPDDSGAEQKSGKTGNAVETIEKEKQLSFDILGEEENIKKTSRKKAVKSDAKEGENNEK